MNDLFIIAHAKSLDAVLVTNNTREFERIEHLKIEDWTKEFYKIGMTFDHVYVLSS